MSPLRLCSESIQEDIDLSDPFQFGKMQRTQSDIMQIMSATDLFFSFSATV